MEMCLGANEALSPLRAGPWVTGLGRKDRSSQLLSVAASNPLHWLTINTDNVLATIHEPSRAPSKVTQSHLF